MGWIRKKILKIVEKAIRENGIQIGEYRLIEREGALTITKR